MTHGESSQTLGMPDATLAAARAAGMTIAVAPQYEGETTPVVRHLRLALAGCGVVGGELLRVLARRIELGESRLPRLGERGVEGGAALEPREDEVRRPVENATNGARPSTA